MKLYTGKGDAGSTDLLGERVGKDDPRIDLIGAIDETTSAIGLGRSLVDDATLDEMLVEVQRDLYRIMASLAFTDELRPDAYQLQPEQVERLEAATDALGARVVIAPAFVVPGESVASAALDLARATARRAERQAVALSHAGHLHDPTILRYMNRLSSFLFVAARAAEAEAGAGPRFAKERG